eukprot:4362587-Amphidinium_carterae.1
MVRFDRGHAAAHPHFSAHLLHTVHCDTTRVKRSSSDFAGAIAVTPAGFNASMAVPQSAPPAAMREAADISTGRCRDNAKHALPFVAKRRHVKGGTLTPTARSGAQQLRLVRWVQEPPKSCGASIHLCCFWQANA